MNFAVVVDVPAVEATASASVLSTCNAALGAQHCAIAGPDVSGQWYARVRFAPDQSTVFSIELYDGDPSGTPVATSRLEFKERDSERERWASAGVVVAALVAAQSSADREPHPPPSSPAPPPAPPVIAPVVRPPVARRLYWMRVDLGATAGSENDSGAVRVGPLARFGLALSELPVFFTGGAAYTVRGSGTPDSTWLTGSLGAGLRLGFAQQRGALELRGEGVLESVTFHASDGGRSAHARRTRGGPRLGLDLSGYLTKNLALLAGAEATVLHPGVDVAVAGEQVDRLPPFAWGLLSALRYDFR